MARFPARSRHARHLGALVNEFDVFVFDSFGVLNVGDTPIGGARERIEALRAAGKQVAVLTNSATVPLGSLANKYDSLGFRFEAHEIISSREVLAKSQKAAGSAMRWGVAAPAISRVDELPGRCHCLDLRDITFEECDGFILLSSQAWTNQLQVRLLDALSSRPRPVLVGNPDLLAPREAGFSLEPGAYAHAMADCVSIAPAFFGKPYANAFEEVMSRLANGIARQRIAMVGDSLHTDILGGAAVGWRTVLVTDHGLVKGLDVPILIDATGITPDFIVPTI